MKFIVRWQGEPEPEADDASRPDPVTDLRHMLGVLGILFLACALPRLLAMDRTLRSPPVASAAGRAEASHPPRWHTDGPPLAIPDRQMQRVEAGDGHGFYARRPGRPGEPADRVLYLRLPDGRFQPVRAHFAH